MAGVQRYVPLCSLIWTVENVGLDGGGVSRDGQEEHVLRDNCFSLTSPVTLYRP